MARRGSARASLEAGLACAGQQGSRVCCLGHSPRHTHRRTNRFRRSPPRARSFGDGKERSRAQFAALLAAAGWRLRAVQAVPGTFFVIEAEPVSTGC